MEASLYERRVLGEWKLLLALAEHNPERIQETMLQDGTISLHLLHTPSRQLDGSSISDHHVSIDFPIHYPATPMTLHLKVPVQHPNVHPQNGFVCLWADHKVSNTVEHALHKTVAILGGRLFNSDAIHVMQQDALHRLQSMQHAEETRLYAPLRGIEVDQSEVMKTLTSRRSRLS